MPDKNSVAIIGMGCVFPKSRDLKEYWQLLYHGKDAITDIPESHWSPSDYYDADPKSPDHVHCKRGGFLPPVAFDPSEFGILPTSLEATDTSQLLGLLAAKMALEDCGYGEDQDFNRDRTSVILGVTGTQELVIPLSSRLGYPRWRKALEDSAVPADKTEEVIQRISDSYIPWQENSFPGLLGNVVAGRISNRLDLRGTNCVVDAACASSMSAIHLAILELLSGRSDMVVTGGVDTLNDIFMHMCFAKTQALSATGDARPFSKDADGTVLGEGIGILILKRLEEAEKDGNRIYAVIRGLGSSSDGKSQSIYSPSVEGQANALRSAYQNAGINPASVGLIEAHGTGTRVGDKVEFEALNQVFGEFSANGHKSALGSVKSMIGHTKASSGAAGLIKTALGLYHKVLPITLKADTPDPGLNIDNSHFYLNTNTRPWFSENGHPRRAGTSAFGFGGSNFHVVLEEYRPEKTEISWDGSVEIIAISARQKSELARDVRHYKEAVARGLSNRELGIKAAESRKRFSSAHPYRLLLVSDQHTEISYLFDRACQALDSADADHAIHLENIFIGGPAKPGKLAFVFPGQGSQYLNMGRDVVSTFPQAMKILERANKKFKDGSLLSDMIFPRPVPAEKDRRRQESILRRTDIAQPAIGAISLAMLNVLRYFEVSPAATCGHSFGELTALCAAGWIDEEALLDLSITRGRLMAEAGGSQGPPQGAMLAVQAPLDELKNLVATSNRKVVLANHNSPSQGVLSGPTTAIVEIEKKCRQKKINAMRLPVSAAFHSEQVKSAGRPFQLALEKIPITPTPVAVFSNTSATAYPAEANEIRTLLGNHLTRPVDFVGEIENLYATGMRTFVEIGPKSVLTGLISDILRDRDVNAWALDAAAGKAYGIADLARLLARLGSLGYPVALPKWENTRSSIRKSRMNVLLSGTNYREQRTEARELGIGNAEGGSVESRGQTAGELGIGPATSSGESNAEGGNVESRAQTPETDHHQRSEPSKRSKPSKRTNENKSNMSKDNRKQSEFILDALKVVQEGLKSMQHLQSQTAAAHQKFLETQTEANRSLQQMMQHTQRLAEQSLGIDSEPRQPASPSPVPLESAPDPEVPEKVIIPTTIDSSERPTRSPLPGTPLDSTLLAVEQKRPEAAANGYSRNSDGQGAAVENLQPTNQLRENIDPIETTMLEIVSQLTGYPVEMLGLDMDIESELGIDSIKRVEILSTLEEKMPALPTVSPDMMGSLKTLGQISEFLTNPADAAAASSQTDGGLTNIAPAVAMDGLNISDRKKSPQPAPDTATVQRKVVTIIDAPAVTASPIKVDANKKVFVTEDNTGLSEQIVEELTRIGIGTVRISLDILKYKKQLPAAAGLIIVQNPQSNQTHQDLKNAFVLAKYLAPNLIDATREDDALFATVTRIDGAFGLTGEKNNQPAQGGLAGLAKTAALEWPNVCCHAIDIAPGWSDNHEIAGAVVKEVLTPGPVEIGLDSGHRRTLGLESRPSPEGQINLASGDVVVISGGARGITAAAALALAKEAGPTLVLLGRSPQPVTEPEWLSPLTDETAIKKAILDNDYKDHKATPAEIDKAFKAHMANREVAANLADIKSSAADVVYYDVDIRDFETVQTVINDIRSKHGSIAAIIHGAGVLEDRLIIDKTLDQFERVFDTKVKGLDNLLQAAPKDHLKYLVLFSSVAARMGNKGQVDYAMANEVLNKMAQDEALKRPDCRVIAINWGPWDGGMVSPALKREFQRNGIHLIPVTEGVQCMLHEMAAGKSEPVEVVIGAEITAAGDHVRRELKRPELVEPTPAVKKQQLSLSFEREVDVAHYPILNSHIIDGQPVVPMALITEWFAHGALHENPGLILHGLDDIRILKGIRLEHEKYHIRLFAGKLKKNGAFYEVAVELRGSKDTGQDAIHSRARAILSDRLVPAPPYQFSKAMIAGAYTKNIQDVYDEILFHGLQLRGIRKIVSCSSRGMVAHISSAPEPRQWISSPLRDQWIADPLVLDCAFQMAILWCFEEKETVSLPSYVTSFRQYRHQFPAEGVTAVLEVTEATSRKMRGNFTFLDTNDEIVARLTGFKAIMDPSLFKAFNPQYKASA
jgi:acyl transferase domain-containing protein